MRCSCLEKCFEIFVQHSLNIRTISLVTTTNRKMILHKILFETQQFNGEKQQRHIDSISEKSSISYSNFFSMLRILRTDKLYYSVILNKDNFIFIIKKQYFSTITSRRMNRVIESCYSRRASL